MSLFEKKIRATLIIEAIGKPAEYLTETLNGIVDKISKEKGTKIKSSKVNEPAPLKNQDGFFSNFAEIDVEVESMLYLVILVFRYMPAHVEVVSPQQATLTNVEWGDVLSEITRKLHSYEEVVRINQGEKVILERKLREILGQKQKPQEKPVEKAEVKETKKESNKEEKK